MRPSSASVVSVAVEAPFASVVADYKELLKPGITAFVVVMAAAGYLVALQGPIDWIALLGLMAGTGLTGGAAGALNHVIERRHDAQMARTQARPVARGRISVIQAVVYATVLVIAGGIVLAATTNWITTGLALLTVALYVGVYTPLKRVTIHNTLVGAIPGALPALGGAAAATGALDAIGWSLFAILYLWQLPHFYALAWMYRKDYLEGGFKMLPSAPNGERTAATLVLGATLALLIAGVLPAALGQAGWLFMGGMGLLGLAFTIPAFSFYSEPTDDRARRLLLASIAYVPAFFVLAVLDFLIRAGG